MAASHERGPHGDLAAEHFGAVRKSDLSATVVRSRRPASSFVRGVQSWWVPTAAPRQLFLDAALREQK